RRLQTFFGADDDATTQSGVVGVAGRTVHGPGITFSKWETHLAGHNHQLLPWPHGLTWWQAAPGEVASGTGSAPSDRFRPKQSGRVPCPNFRVRTEAAARARSTVSPAEPSRLRLPARSA